MPILTRAVIFIMALWTASAVVAEESSAKKVIGDFYKNYLNYLNAKVARKHKPVLRYSQAFEQAIKNNHAICKKYSEGVCGWAADGDEYLNAQDFDARLNYETSGFKITEVSKQQIQVEFNLFPFEKERQRYTRKILFKMLQEHRQWVVEDIVYEGEGSARQQIEEENQFYLSDGATGQAQ